MSEQRRGILRANRAVGDGLVSRVIPDGQGCVFASPGGGLKQRQPGKTVQRVAQRLVPCGQADANKSFSPCAKTRARRHQNMRFLQQQAGKLLRTVAGRHAEPEEESALCVTRRPAQRG